MTTLTLGIGISLIIFSMISMLHWFALDEWKAPLLELRSELSGLQEFQSGVRRRGISIPIFFLILFGLGAVLMLKSPILENYRKVILVILGILLAWSLKGAYELVKATYSKKTRLLNYLFSPYLFAWRRDRLSKYSDQEIAAAILNVCNIHDNSLIKENMDLKDFLIALHKKTRPSIEHDAYTEMLDENISQSEKIREIRV